MFVGGNSEHKFNKKQGLEFAVGEGDKRCIQKMDLGGTESQAHVGGWRGQKCVQMPTESNLYEAWHPNEKMQNKSLSKQV
jgi:hypothetical protein